MSNLAEAWAWKQDIPLTTKGILLALADHADDEGICWPGVKGLAQKCRVSPTTIRHHLRVLRTRGLISAQKRQRTDGTQTSNLYHLHVNILTPPLQLVDTPPIADLEEGVQLVHTHEPSLETSKETYIYVDQDTGEISEPDNSEVWPEWYATLRTIPGFNVPLSQATSWLSKKGITDDHAETTAYALKSRWDGRKYKDSWATFQNWAKRPPIPGNGRTSVAPSNAPDDRKEFLRRYGHLMSVATEDRQ